MLAGARSIAAIAEWAADAEATIRRKLARLDADADALAGATGAWLADRERRGPAVSRRRAVAVDGKTLRGARGAGADGRPVHLLAAMDHQSRTVLPNARSAAPPRTQLLLAPWTGRRGGHRRRAADSPRRRRVPSRHQADHYLFVVKANQPTLLDRCQRLPWRLVPIAERARDRSHGRVEVRTLMVVSVHHFGFPHATQVLQVTRKTRDLNATTRRLRTVTVCALTSLPFEQASPARLGRPAARALGRSRRSTTSAMSPSPRTPPGPHRRRPPGHG